LNTTLCGCLRFDDERYEWHKTQRVVSRHYRDNPKCRAKARQSPVWLQRAPLPVDPCLECPTDTKIACLRDPAYPCAKWEEYQGEHDPEYDEEERNG
jgi:hypothetical protein